ncbi:hypothetical protein [Rubellimicrobium arenae]|uniref:hypothetical protein n=1 Tax=Rubellimicrobium arenae TaxID=2817372 RepID=UPI001B301ED6|nr:hypothetical protein [Rubellimicrobium arenae]
MIYPLGGLLLGAILGGLNARRRGGRRLDLLQWTAVGAIVGAIVGVFLLVILERNGVAAG